MCSISSIFKKCKEVKSWKGMRSSVDDASSLLDTLLVMSSFLCAFSLSLTVCTFSHADLLEADIRNLLLKEQLGSGWWFMSVHFLESGLRATVCFLSALFVACVTNLSLAFSNGRESTVAFDNWFWWFKWLILAAYIVFGVGVYNFFWCAHVSIEMIYPRYSLFLSENTDDKRQLELMRERFWNVTTRQLSEIQDMEFVPRVAQYWQSAQGLGIAWELSKKNTDFLIVIMFSTVSIIFAMSIYLSCSKAQAIRLSCACCSKAQATTQATRINSNQNSSMTMEETASEIEDQQMKDFLSEMKLLELYQHLQVAGLSQTLLLQNADRPLLLNELLKDAGIVLPGKRLALISALQVASEVNAEYSKRN
eukprot:gb/GEZN01010179.1/.p1 GENE.gb/GEZN01010179.1/~~gb/GEZN01010179.1/.p1  ORF type:complete len:394 (+),score=26.28 gb/GEZN01010179.1/:88-1182(+)